MIEVSEDTDLLEAKKPIQIADKLETAANELITLATHIKAIDPDLGRKWGRVASILKGTAIRIQMEVGE